MDKIGDIMSSQWLKEPPKLSHGGLADLIGGIKLGIDIHKLDRDTRYRLVQFFAGAPDSIIERWFDSDKVKAMVASHCLPANYASLHQPGAGLAMLHHAVGEIDGKKGAWGIVKGGMGSITKAMAESATAKGVVIRTNAPVQKFFQPGPR